MDNLNSEEYWDNRFENNWEHFNGKEQTQFFVKCAIKLMPDWLEFEIKEKKLSICDVGCAFGDATDFLSCHFQTQVIGVDFSKKAIEKANANYPMISFKELDISNMDNNNLDLYDVVYCSNVLEHFLNYRTILENLTKISKKYVILLIPFQEDMIIEEHLTRFDPKNIPLNINEFELIYAATINGSEIDNTYYADLQIFLVYCNDIEMKLSSNFSNILNNVETKERMEIVKQFEKNIQELNKEKRKFENKCNHFYDDLKEYIELNDILNNEKLNIEKEKIAKEEEILKLTKEKDDEISKLKEEKKGNEKEIKVLQKDKAYLENENEQYILNIAKMEHDFLNLNEKLNIITNKYNSLENDLVWHKNHIYQLQMELTSLYSSLSWKITSPFRTIGKVTGFSSLHVKIRNNELGISLYHLLKKNKRFKRLKKLIPVEIKDKVSAKYNKPLSLNSNNNANIINQLDIFMKKVNNESKDLIMIFSGVKYIDSEGQRNIRFVHEAIQKNIMVIFLYWRWDRNEPVEESSDNILQIPIDLFHENKIDFIENRLVCNTKKVFLIEFPQRFALDILEIVNCFGWITAYDVIDDWEEFLKKGQAPWYEKKVEVAISNNVDVNIATAKRLKEKISLDLFERKPYYLIGNGVNPDRMRPSLCDIKYDYCRGDIQIGYFGHLTDAWFDWELINNVARHYPKWTFHLIGYGQPEEIKVCDNVILYGKKEHNELAKYAAFWDVAIIPFINCELTLSVNPIKIYEYLQLGLPVVATYMPEIENFPYTKITSTEKEFCMAIKEAAKIKFDKKKVEEFIKENTWEKKFEQLWLSVNNVDLSNTYKYILKE